MDISELTMMLESVNCQEVTAEEFQNASFRSSKLSKLDSDQKLLLYALFKQSTIGDVDIPKPDSDDIVSISKWFEVFIFNCLK